MNDAKKYEVSTDPDFEIARECVGSDPESAAAHYVELSYGDGWSDRFTLYAREAGSSESFAVEVEAYMKLHVETSKARRIDRD